MITKILRLQACAHWRHDDILMRVCGFGAALTVVWLVGTASSAQGQSFFTDLDVGAPPSRIEGGAAAARAPIEPDRQVSPEEAESDTAAREEQVWAAYEKWQNDTAEADSARADPVSAAESSEVSRRAAAAGVPPPPDAPDGEITIERQQWQGLR